MSWGQILHFQGSATLTSASVSRLAVLLPVWGTRCKGPSDPPPSPTIAEELATLSIPHHPCYMSRKTMAILDNPFRSPMEPLSHSLSPPCTLCEELPADPLVFTVPMET